MGSQLLLWETEVRQTAEGKAEVVAKRPRFECSVDEARVYLGGKHVISRRQVYTLYRRGVIDGYKPGEVEERSDGKASNAKLVLYVESLLRHRGCS